jgi:hypothetical protein
MSEHLRQLACIPLWTVTRDGQPRNAMTDR